MYKIRKLFVEKIKEFELERWCRGGNKLFIYYIDSGSFIKYFKCGRGEWELLIVYGIYKFFGVIWFFIFSYR